MFFNNIYLKDSLLQIKRFKLTEIYFSQKLIDTFFSLTNSLVCIFFIFRFRNRLLFLFPIKRLNF
jgi:hypothetical protein